MPDSISPPGGPDATSPHGGPRGRALPTLLLLAHLLLVILFALCCRLTGLMATSAGGKARFVDPQSQYHARRVVEAARAFPSLPRGDDKLAYPAGVEQRVAFGLHYLAAAVSHGLGTPPAAAVWCGVGLMLALGALASALAFLLARALALSSRWSLLAGLLLAAWPAHVEYTRMGRIAPEAAEALATLAALWLLVRAVTRQRAGGRTGGWAAGVALGLGFWLSPSMLLPALALATAALVVQRRERALAGLVQRCSGAALVVVAAALVVDPRLVAAQQGATLFAVALAASRGLSWLGRWEARRREDPQHQERRWSTPRISALLIGVGALIAAGGLLVGPTGEVLTEGFWTAVGVGPMTLLRDQRPSVLLGFEGAALMLTYLGMLLPVALYLLARWSRGESAERRLVLAVSIALVCLGLVQFRVMATAVAVCAAAWALFVERLTARLGERLGSRPERRWVGLGLVSVTIFLASPSIDYLAKHRVVVGYHTLAREGAVEWLGRNAAPGEAAMAPIGFAHSVARLAGRPVVGSTLNVAETAEANRDVVRFFRAANPEEALAIARRRGVRWVVNSRFRSEDFHDLSVAFDPSTNDQVTKRRYRRSLSTRLQSDSGAAGEQGALYLPAVRWLQLVHEARYFGGIFGRWSAGQIYRVVAGARLHGRCAPRRLVTLALLVESNLRRRFVYRDWARADGAGRFELIVPYHSEPPRAPLAARLAGPVEVGCEGGARWAVHVSRAAVERGEALELPR